ncbi:MAG: ATPase, partial [Duncaniella sp.]|nr:ATPase [Duncaniella sp.]
MKFYTVAIVAAAMLCTLSATADDSSPKLKINPTGRILMDGAVYLGGNRGVAEAGDTKFVNGVAIPDIRLGAKASYGKFKAKIDVGFSYGKVGLKDTYFEYDINEANFLRAGYFVPQWGLN